MSSTTITNISRINPMPVHRRLLLAGGISVAYLILSCFLIGFRPEQIFISGLFFVLYTVSKKTRNFLLTLMPFIVFWVIFDYMKAFPNYRFNTVHVGDLYALEKEYFGFNYRGTIHTINEFWALNRSTLLDVLNGFFYLCWMPVPISFAGYLFFKDRKAAIEFCLTFLLTNFVGFIGYYGYPAAPPWYIHEHGMVFNPATPGNVAGLAGFDHFFGVQIFHGLYAKSSNVFAAMPSLHAAYALVSVYYAYRKNVATGWKIFLTIVCLGTWFAALYTDHHYLIDVLVGILCATIGIALFRSVLLKSKAFSRFMRSYYQQVA
ncbi:phosphatase PAP2 family protein [Taibaiella koreensis]|uniref:phosphatase PAP2 family protein n=1 Tax=Taibaiella koreensis TaxID=1268548 RepID=UPI001F095693|nr:phosphatase PAP2 family protein [Taibaiella koreensis]